jgi:hypothetical protein
MSTLIEVGHGAVVSEVVPHGVALHAIDTSWLLKRG